MERFFNKLLELFEESIILQGFITMSAFGTYCYLVIVGREIPSGLDNMMWAILAFWFGTKSQAAVSSTIKRLGNGKSRPDSGAATRNSSS